MVESAARLMALLRGERVRKPPLFEPWFNHHALLAERYGGELLHLAEDLDHAAVRLPGVGTNTITYQHAATPGTGYYAGGAITDPLALTALPEPDWDAQTAALLLHRRAAADAGRACWLVIVGCFPALNVSMGLERFALACLECPERVAEAAEWVEQRNRVAVQRVVAEVRPDFVLWDSDCAYKNGTMIRPSLLRDLFAEPMRRSLAQVHALGLPVALHTDGKLDEVIPLLVDLGVAAVHGCEAAANDLGGLVEQHGDDIVLCGNMDVVFLTHAAPKEVRTATFAMLETGARKGRFAAGCNTSPENYIPLDNYVAMCRAIAAWQPV